MANPTLEAVYWLLGRTYSVLSDLFTSWLTTADYALRQYRAYLERLLPQVTFAFLLELGLAIITEIVVPCVLGLILGMFLSCLWTVYKGTPTSRKYTDQAIQTVTPSASPKAKPVGITSRSRSRASTAAGQAKLPKTVKLDPAVDSRKPMVLSGADTNGAFPSLPKIIVHPAPTTEALPPSEIPNPPSTPVPAVSLVTPASEPKPCEEPAKPSSTTLQPVEVGVSTPAGSAKTQQDTSASTSKASSAPKARSAERNDTILPKQPAETPGDKNSTPEQPTPSPATTNPTPPANKPLRTRPRRLILTPVLKPLPSRGVDFMHSTEVIDLTGPHPEDEPTPLGDHTNTTNTNLAVQAVDGPTTRLRAKMRTHTATRPDWAVAPAGQSDGEGEGEGGLKVARAKPTRGRRGRKRTVTDPAPRVVDGLENAEAVYDATTGKGTGETAKGKAGGRGRA